ncbi:cytochrome-c peroxidase [Caenimonas koreensis]|uniref:cytochrome-c peroxidase n=1 Tax=Caenimonas koreensis TaxID=367474 RepID=UPI003783CDB3
MKFAGDMWRVLLASMLVTACALSACGGGGPAPALGPINEPVPNPSLSPAARLGEKIFRDTSLSASGQQACVSCHEPANAHAAPFTTPVAFGGPQMDQAGTRNSPSLRYLRFNTKFAVDASGNPSGGFFWDGRSDSLAAQARDPFLNAAELANPDVQSVIDKLMRAPYADEFRSVFGAGIFSDANAAFDRLAFALERYQLEDVDFAPFTSKFDAFMGFAVNLTPQEMNGYVLFDRADKGNCASCHTSTRPDNAPLALFTNFGYASLGVPRNAQIPANADASFRDSGLCNARAGFATRTEWCGSFRVPSLRNVAVRQRFFHNGRFSVLEDAIRFHVRRDTDLPLWYPVDALGNLQPYDDLLASERANVTRQAPFDRKAGDAPALTEQEISDIAAFLRTLTDGASRS